MNRKQFEPNLIDPIVGKKIINSMKPIEEDYWGSARDMYNKIIDKIVKPNMVLIIIIILVVIYLIYRYRNIKHKNRISELNKNEDINKKNNDEYTDLLKQLYKYEIERTTEPSIKRKL